MVQVKYNEIFFYLFFGLLSFAKGIGLYDGQPAFKLVLIFAGLALLCKLCLEKYNDKQMLIIICLFLLGAITYFLSGEKGLLLNCMLVVGMHNMKSQNVFKLAGIVWSISLIGNVVSSLFHMEDTVYKVHDKLGLGHVFRWSFGYGHPNVLQITYLILAIIIIYLLGENFKLWHGGMLLLGNLIFFLYSVSYTGFITVSCLLIGRVYLLYRPRLCKIEKVLLQLVFPVCIALSLVAPLVLKGKAFEILNKLMNTRLGLARYFLTQDYVHMWGNRLSEIISESLTMDNAYVFAMITYGVVPFMLIVVFTLYMIYQLVKKAQYIEVLILLIISIGGLTEPFLYNTSFKNLSFVFIGEYIFRAVEGNEKYSLLAKWNKEKQIGDRVLEIVRLGKEKLLVGRTAKVLIAIAGACLVCFLSNIMIAYPEGYVVYRADCSDLEKNFHYYGEENIDEDYKEMEDFKQGELIEYFGGNIVLVERIRNSIMALLLGFAGCYLSVGIYELTTGQLRRKA